MNRFFKIFILFYKYFTFVPRFEMYSRFCTINKLINDEFQAFMNLGTCFPCNLH